MTRDEAIRNAAWVRLDKTFPLWPFWLVTMGRLELVTFWAHLREFVYERVGYFLMTVRFCAKMDRRRYVRMVRELF